ncbi:hypothetical protein RN001_009892 [Aquatica leii]|uniref:Leucine-rich repeat-containing protein 59 n=1 Tax=Aquatica leii TaxID=1421715 RepID=A0AAN7P9A6_9COLE|nr:hypothetical protein RN001_009892 [Aquatica leii]
MAPSATKINLKDKVEDGEIDLSMLDLHDVPVKEIAAIRKAHSLDLSNNHISTLPRNFSILVNLTKLDLSKNEITELPENFGELHKLKHLDLYRNQLQQLPLSFSKLKALRWLDLKDNKLMPIILEISGPCLEPKQCQDCAKNIVAFYTKLDNAVQRERSLREEQHQKELQESLEKAKQEKKKKVKKEKIVTAKEISDKNVQSKVSSTNTTTINAKKSATKIKQKPQSSVYSYFKFITVAFLLLIFTLFILTSAKIECLKIVETKVVETWTLGLGQLPNQLQYVGLVFGENMKLLHDLTGKGVVIATNYLSNYNSLNIIVTEVAQVFKNASTTASKIYLKVFGK